MPSIMPEITNGIIIMSRVRLARNINGCPFRITDKSLAKNVVKTVNRALVKTDTFNLYYMENLTTLVKESMKERHLVSENLIKNVECGAVLINQDESLSIMINEEDVIREQCFMKGLRLEEAYKRLDVIDDELSKYLDIAFDKDLGYLTACPTNLGTGLRASVMMFLPALTESGKITQLVEEVERLGLTIRGVYGEGSKAEGYMYQISNEVTLGASEYEILNTVRNAVEEICLAERKEIEKIYLKKEITTMDRARKSYGILTNALLLEYNEFLEHIARVKIGAMLGMININEIDKIDDLIVNVRPASLCESYGKKLSSIDRDLVRAERVAHQLKKLKE
ncbi:MAG: ATP--guanido phosphotransferase [Clostridia bacterium]|nr:ATP--guanido phosphotransferase [Clostridia bacterium]